MSLMMSQLHRFWCLFLQLVLKERHRKQCSLEKHLTFTGHRIDYKQNVLIFLNNKGTMIEFKILRFFKRTNIKGTILGLEK